MTLSDILGSAEVERGACWPSHVDKEARVNPKLLRWLLVLCLAVFTTSVAKNAHAAVPETIQYSGALAIEGSPMDGRADLSFKLYNSASGGSSIWSESHAGHAINGGQFGVELGSQSPLGPALDGGPLWLEVSVNGVVLSPRQQVSSAPYALRALDAETFGGHEPSDFLSASTPMTAESVIYAGRSSTPQVQGALDQLFTLLDGLQATVSDQGDMLSSLSTELASTTAELAALRIEYDLSVSENQQLSAELESMQLWSIGADSSLFDLSAAVLDMQGSLSQTSANVSNLEDATDSLSGELNSLDARVSSLESSSAGGSGEGDLGGLMSRVDDLEAQASQNEQGLADLSGSLSDYALNSDLAQMQGQLSALESTTDGLSGELSGLDARLTDVELSGGEGSSGGDFSGLISRIDGIELRVDDNEQELADIAASFDDYALSTELGQLQQQVTALDSAFGDLDDRFDGLELDINQLELELDNLDNSIQGQFVTLNGDISMHDAQLFNLDAALTLLQGTVSDHSSALGGLDDWAPGVDLQLSTLEGDIYTLDNDFTILDSTVTTLSSYNLNSRLSSLESWRTDDIDTFIDDAGDDIADLLTRTQYQRAELVGGLPGLVFEGTNLYVRSGSPEYLGGHTCRGEEPPTQMAPIADPSRQKSRPACDDDPKEGIYCDGTMDMMNCHIENMEGAGLGNLIIGYGKPTMDDSFESGGMDPDSGAIKLGMHNLVIGLGHNWAGTYNILHGIDHYVEQDYAAAIGGQYNYVLAYTHQAGPFFPMGAVMVGGFGNIVDASMATLLGGYGDLSTDPGWGEAQIGDPEAFYEP